MEIKTEEWELNRRMTGDELMDYDTRLRALEREIEKLARRVCSVPGSVETWSALDRAAAEIRCAINGEWAMRGEG